MENPSEVEFSASPAQRRAREEPAEGGGVPALTPDSGWRGELSQRLQAYRARRGKSAPNIAQSEFSFEAPNDPRASETSITVEEPPATGDETFSFTIAIGRNSAARADSPVVIDVSTPPDADQSLAFAPASAASSEDTRLVPVASLEERRIAGLIDTACLLFAFGAFLTLFGSLGGQFTLSKLSAAVCVATFVIVYLQYFALFTVFGGTTPGMMLRGLHVVSLSGETPSPRQMLWRSLGYMLSAGTLFMGFFWALWDEDGLTWHDRLSRTYLCPAPTFADIDATHPAPSR